MLTFLGWRPRGATADTQVSEDTPLPVRMAEDDDGLLRLPAPAGTTISVARAIPGIGTGVAYADGDALGTLIEFPNVVRARRRSGTLMAALYYDLDDEGLTVDLHLFAQSITSGTDNSAYDPSDAEVRAYVGTVTFTTFSNLGSNQVSAVSNIGLDFVLEGTSLYGQAVARGALNVAADHLPWLRLVIRPD